MDIGEVSKLTGLAVSTLRYYEQKGLIKSYGRHGLRRQFESKVVKHLKVINLATSAGFSLDEINEILAPQRNELDRARLIEKADEIDSKIKKLTKMRDGLRHAAACQAPSHFECPKFLKLLELTTHKKIKNSHIR